MDRVNTAEDKGPLPWWAPTAKTPSLVGIVTEYRSVTTDYGPLQGVALLLEQQAVVMDDKKSDPRLADIGEEVMVWLKQTTLKNSWHEPHPVGAAAAVGDRVGIKRMGEREGSRGKYTVFQVFVDGRDGMSPELPSEPMTQAEAIIDDPSFGDPSLPQDDDLPF